MSVQKSSQDSVFFHGPCKSFNINNHVSVPMMCFYIFNIVFFVIFHFPLKLFSSFSTAAFSIRHLVNLLSILFQILLHCYAEKYGYVFIDSFTFSDSGITKSPRKSEAIRSRASTCSAFYVGDDAFYVGD